MFLIYPHLKSLKAWDLAILVANELDHYIRSNWFCRMCLDIARILVMYVQEHHRVDNIWISFCLPKVNHPKVLVTYVVGNRDIVQKNTAYNFVIQNSHPDINSKSFLKVSNDGHCHFQAIMTVSIKLAVVGKSAFIRP